MRNFIKNFFCLKQPFFVVYILYCKISLICFFFQCGYDDVSSSTSSPNSNANNGLNCRTEVEEVCEEVAAPNCQTIMESVCSPVKETVCEDDIKQGPKTR